MLQEYEIHRFSRRCAATGRRLEPGETYVSALIDRVGRTERIDLAAESWTGPPDDCVGWWRSAVPRPGAKPTAAPTEVLLGLLESWAGDPVRAELRYVLALLLVRRRVLRFESDAFLEAIEDRAASPYEALRVHCPASGVTYEIEPATPGPDRVAALENELTALLHTDAEPQASAA